jgi:hypothetical protein
MVRKFAILLVSGIVVTTQERRAFFLHTALRAYHADQVGAADLHVVAEAQLVEFLQVFAAHRVAPGVWNGERASTSAP